MKTEDSELTKSWEEGHTGYICLNRADKANAYTNKMLDLLESQFHELESNDAIRSIIITGSGESAFCAGADLNEMKGVDYKTALDLKSAKLFAKIANSTKITIAAINGPAVAGGLELTLACDFRIALPHSTFSFPETNLGLIPAAGGTQRLPALVGVGRAKELILAGRIWNTKTALQYGLLNEVVENDLLSAAQQWADAVAKLDPLALKLAKQAMTSDDSELGHHFEKLAEALLYHLKND
jgi:enoyl-CoA hydratase